MSRRTFGALLVLNLVLLATLLALVWEPQPAAAQPAMPQSRYSMIAGTSRQRTNQDLIYVIDWNTNRMAAFYYDGRANRVTVVDDISLNAAAQESGRRR